MVLALAAGCALAAAAYYSWTLQAEVRHLQAQVCAYQQAAVTLAGALNRAGAHVTVAPPAAC